MADAQIYYSHHFTEKIQEYNLLFTEPVEGFYKPKMITEDDYMNYDLVIVNRRTKFEIRFQIEDHHQYQIPHIEFLRLLSSISINDNHFDIKVIPVEDDVLQEYFHADWGVYADFIPKRDYSKYHYGRMIAIKNEEGPLIFQVMLFNEYNKELDRRFYSIAFPELDPDG